MTSPVRILVADDSRTARESVIAVLGTLDNAVVTLVENGAQALKEACMGTYALFICDIEMPVMTGSQVLRVLRTQFFSSTELPIIMMTQYGEAEQKVRAFGDGANDYVTKPVEPQELLARAKAQIELRRLYRESLANQAITLHAQKLAAVAQLSASVSHELNTPAQYLSDNLAFLTNAFNQLMSAPQNDQAGADRPGRFELGYLEQEVPKSLADMREGVHRIATIVQTIREFAEADTDRIVNIDLRKTVVPWTGQKGPRRDLRDTRSHAHLHEGARRSRTTGFHRHDAAHAQRFPAPYALGHSGQASRRVDSGHQRRRLDDGLAEDSGLMLTRRT
jgi:DNA-binding response OmpR family regulator